MIFISRMKTTCHKTATISSPPGQFIFSPQCSSSTYCCTSPSKLRSRKLNSQARTIFPKQLPNWFQISKQKCRRNLPFVFLKLLNWKDIQLVFFPCSACRFSLFLPTSVPPHPFFLSRKRAGLHLPPLRITCPIVNPCPNICRLEQNVARLFFWGANLMV